MRIKKVLASVLSAVVIITTFATTAFAAGPGWQEESSGKWRYYTDSSTYVKSDWKQIGGKWYLFDYSGYAYMDAWVRQYNYSSGQSKIYHFDKNGAMETNKWIDCGKSNYSYEVEKFIKESGTTDTSWNQFLNLRDWRYVGSDGVAYTGWKQVGGKWYFFEDGSNSGSNYNYWGLMAYGICYAGSDMYCFDKNGQYEKNKWIRANESYWMLFGSSGKAYRNEWYKENGKWYYFDNACHMIADTSNYNIGGKSYSFDKSGACKNPSGSSVKSGWSQANNEWYYFESNGSLAKGWKQIGGKWYYFNTTNGAMTTGVKTISGKMYYFDKNGAMQTGWIKLPKLSYMSYDYWIFCGSDGAAYSNQWLQQNGKWYYFSSSYDNAMMINRTGVYVKGLYYDFDANGVCTNPSGRSTYKA